MAQKATSRPTKGRNRKSKPGTEPAAEQTAPACAPSEAADEQAAAADEGASLPPTAVSRSGGDEVSAVETAVADSLQTAAEAAHLAPRLERPLRMAAIFSVLWVVAFVALAILSPWGEAVRAAGPAAWTGALAAAMMPLVLFWLVALVVQRTDPLLEHRLGIARNLDATLAPIDHAEKRVLLLREDLRAGLAELEATAELTGERLESLKTRFSEQLDQLFSAAAAAEERAQAVAERLEEERALIARSSAALEEQEHRLAELVASSEDRLVAAAARLQESEETLAARLEQLDALSTEIAERISGTAATLEADLQRAQDSFAARREAFAADVEAVAAQVARLAEQDETLATRAEAIRERGAALVRHVEESMARAGEVLTAALGRLETWRNDVERGWQEALAREEAARQRFRDQLSELHAQAEERAAGLRENWLHQAEEGLAQIEGRLTRFRDGVAEAQSRIAEATDAFLERLDDQAARLEEAARGRIDALSRMQERLVADTELVAERLKAAEEALQAVGETLSRQTDSLGQTLERMQRELETADRQMAASEARLAETSEAVTKQLAESGEALGREAESLASRGEEITNRLDRQATLLKGHIAALGEAGTSGIGALEQAAEKLRSEGQTLLKTLERSAGALGEAAGAFGGERQRILEETEAAAHRLEDAARHFSTLAAELATQESTSAERLGQLAARFSESARTIAETAAEAERAALEHGRAFEAAFQESVAHGLKEVGRSMDSLNTLFGAEIASLEEKVSESVDKALARMRETVAAAEREAEALSQAIGRTTAALTKKAEGFLARSERIRAQIEQEGRDRFLETANLVIESLQSAAIDIHRLLAQEVPDDLWKRYVAGDRTIFFRRTVRLADRGTRAKIEKKFAADPEFRAAAARYMRDFESLLEQAMARDRQGALTVTLLSSEMGKLYVILAQSLKKLQ